MRQCVFVMYGTGIVVQRLSNELTLICLASKHRNGSGFALEKPATSLYKD